MSATLNPHHLARYREIGALLVKHHRAEGLRDLHTDTNGPLAEEAKLDAAELADQLEAMGPTFVKLGQLLSTRADLLPQVYLDALSRLQDHVEPVPFEEIEEIATTEIGARLSKAFQVFEHKPMASASLGQVHRAVLRDGRAVAVKVQRPGVKKRVIEDMEVIEELAAFVDSHTDTGRALGFAAMVEEFRRSIMAELDYRLEAANLVLLASNLTSYDRIVVPQSVPDYSSSVVLTMELIDGRNVGSLGPLARVELEGRPLAAQLFDAYLDQILLDGFVHADPHPGNVLLTSDGRLALIDLGMVLRVSPELQDALVRLLLGVCEARGHDVAEVMAKIGQKGDAWDQDRFERSITALVQENQAARVDQLEAGRTVGELARIAVECGLRPPAELTMLGKTLLNLDQVATALDPQFEPNAAIQHHVSDIMRRKMLRGVSPARMLSAAIDAKEFAEKLPGRVNKVMDALAEGQITLNIQGLDEKELMRGTQKLANRLTSGLIIAALIVGAAMLMRINTSSKLFGYPSVAIICFLCAAIAGVWLILNCILHDLPQRPRRR
jgi:ubiquinone biosynthesis protein